MTTLLRCPSVPFTAAEERRERFLLRLAAAFQAQMDEQRNPCALKGGTALRFQAGLPRPSTDLDFEGDGRVNVRRTLAQALAAAPPAGPYRIGRDLLWRGTVRVNVWDAEAGWLETSVDYRRTGTRAGMPDKVPLDRCERVRGINIYTDADLVRRKLVTVVGPRPRQKARDIYDAAWVVSHRPELVLPDDAAKLRQWLDGLTPRAREELQRRLRSEEVTGRVSAAQVWNALEAGVRTLGPAPPGCGSGGAGPGSSPPPLDPGLPDGGGASLAVTPRSAPLPAL